MYFYEPLLLLIYTMESSLRVVKSFSNNSTIIYFGLNFYSNNDILKFIVIHTLKCFKKKISRNKSFRILKSDNFNYQKEVSVLVEIVCEIKTQENFLDRNAKW